MCCKVEQGPQQLPMLETKALALLYLSVFRLYSFDNNQVYRHRWLRIYLRIGPLLDSRPNAEAAKTPPWPHRNLLS